MHTELSQALAGQPQHLRERRGEGEQLEAVQRYLENTIVPSKSLSPRCRNPMASWMQPERKASRMA